MEFEFGDLVVIEDYPTLVWMVLGVAKESFEYTDEYAGDQYFVDHVALLNLGDPTTTNEWDMYAGYVNGYATNCLTRWVRKED